MKSIYNLAVRERNSLSSQLQEYSDSSNPAATILQSQITNSLNAFSSKIDQYENLARQEPSREKQQEFLSRSKKLRESLTENQSKFEALRERRNLAGPGPAADLKSPPQPRHQSSHSYSASSEPEPKRSPLQTISSGQQPELLGRRPYVSASDPRSSATSPAYNPNAGPSTHAHAHHQAHAPHQPAAWSSHSHPPSTGPSKPGQFTDPLRAFTVGASARLDAELDNIIQSGGNTLRNLVEQREMMKGTQRRLFSAANTLGISGETIRMIERRAREDKVIFGGAVVAFFVFAWLVLRFFRG